MPPFQNSEAIRPAVGFPGMMADMSEWNATTGFIMEEGLQPGFPVAYGDEDRQFVSYDGTNAFAGILRAHINHAPVNAALDPAAQVYEVNTTAGAVDAGQIYVLATGTATRGGPVFFQGANGGYADTGAVPILGAEFVTSGVAGDVVIVKLTKIPGGIPAAEAPAG